MHVVIKALMNTPALFTFPFIIMRISLLGTKSCLKVFVTSILMNLDGR